MRDGSGTFAKLGLTGLAMALATGGLPANAGEGSGAPATRATGGDVSITVTEMRNAKGTVLACMTSDPERFPKCRGDADAYMVKVPAGKAAHLTFKDVKPGRYAIALLHDENGNGKADRALGMMPKEGFGFSRDAPVKMAPPKFGDAAFDYSGKATSLTIRMRYML